MLCIAVISTVIVAAPNAKSSCPITNIVHEDGCCTVLLPDSDEVSIQGSCTDNNVIDVLWVYTPDALAYIGSPEEVLFQCQIAVDDANVTFANTQLPFSVRIVGLHETDYEETDEQKGE